jgi:hypothetical protein
MIVLAMTFTQVNNKSFSTIDYFLTREKDFSIIHDSPLIDSFLSDGFNTLS